MESVIAEANVYDVLIAVIVQLGVIAAAVAYPAVKLLRRSKAAEKHSAEAKVEAAKAKETGQQVQLAVGEPNGNGNLTQMVERLLAESAEATAWQKNATEWQRNAGLWMAEHDVKDDATRQEVSDMRRYMGMPENEK
jgi:Rieske Fe-S protein